CTVPPAPLVPGAPPCVPVGETLFIPNVTTDVGLSPPYNSLFTLFGQFFDHGVDQTVKGGGTVFVPLKEDDPLRTVGPDNLPNTGDEVPESQAFMVLTRAQNQPGGVKEAENTDSPFVDQSQTYASHPSHQVFLREYVNNTAGRPVSTGKLLGGPPGLTAGGMATWATVKQQARTLLGLELQDKDVLNVPQMAVDPYGKFIPGPARGLPQYVTTVTPATPTGLVEGNIGAPIPVPGNVLYFDTPFLTDIAHNADPTPINADGQAATPPTTPLPDSDTLASADFAKQPVGTYDDEMLAAHFAAGDGRVNENIGLTAIHQVFHSEHDRLADEFKQTLANDTSVKGLAALSEWKLATGAGGWNGERLFQAARFVTEMEYQHIVFEDFGRKIQPAIDPFRVYHTDLNPAVTAEFAHAVYRFGHSMLTDTISRTNENGSTNDVSLLEGFLNPPKYTDGGIAGPLTSEEAAGSIFMGMSDQVGNELDEFVTDTLRNNLLGLPLDLATINMARARETGVPSLNELRREIHNATGDAQLTPYTSWSDFAQNVKHPESVINFVAAYGTHPSITGAPTLAAKRNAARLMVSPNPLGSPPDLPATRDMLDFLNSAGIYANTENGVNNIDLWVGGLAEKTNLFGGLLGSTFNYVFENQMTGLQNGDRFYYLARTPGMNLRASLEGNSFAELMMRNTNAHTLKADAFATADCKFELKNLGNTAAAYSEATGGPTVADDPASECNENALLLRKPDGTIQYKEKNSVDPSGINGQSVFNGTDGVNRVTGGNDNDTFLGNEGNDVIEGAGGDDIALGGDGEDRITDLAGDDIQKGGPGNDYLTGGIGLDVLMGADGQDFTNGGANNNATFAGEGNDFVRAGDGTDTSFGDGGDDWIQGGSGQDLMIGDHAAPFFDDASQTKPGNDIFIGQVGENDYDAEGGDDIMTSNSAIDRYAGSAGFDWANHQYDTVGADDDMAINKNLIGVPLPQVVNRDRWQEVEANSGSAFNDVIRGDDTVPSTVGGAGFTGCDVLDQAGINRVNGLGAILPAPSTPLASVERISAPGACPLEGPVWGEGNILLGGIGSDVLEGRGANDVLDGDRYLQVRISVRNDAGAEIGTTDLLENTYQAGNTHTLEQDVAAGVVSAGNLVAVREIVTPTADQATGNVDTALFSDVRANYTVTTTGGTGVLGSAGSITTVVHNGGTDGTDTLRNIERLLFSDTVPPSVPVIGTATAGNARATVNWTAGATGVATRFDVRVFNDAGTQVGGLRTVQAPATSLVVTGLTNGSPYRFQVSASNAEGTSEYSALSNAVTPSGPVAVVAGTPRAVTGTARNGAVALSWQAPLAVANAAPITGYRIRTYQGTGATVFREVTTTGTATTAVIDNLTNGIGYTFDVSAINSVDIGAPSARSASITPVAQVVAGATRTVTGVPGNTQVTLSWQAPAAVANAAPITGYRIRTYQGTGATVLREATTTGTATTAVIGSLTNGIGYTFDVSAINSVGTGAPSARSASITPRADVVAPTVTSTTPANGATGVSRTANITGTFSEDITGYNATSVRLVRVNTGTVWAAGLSFNAATNVLTINPTSTLVANTQFRVTITGSATGVRDLAGNPVATRSLTFTTGAN
ncbi:MAG: heme peroxidase, partial [Cryobacterium sp.]|nr:heme peroxidase [Cryobacterium sp.]